VSLAALLLLGCQKVELGILVNASGEAIRVTYTVARFRTQEGGPLRCNPNDYPVSVRRTPRNHRWAARDWVSSTTASLDTQTCTISLTLAPGFSALIFHQPILRPLPGPARREAGAAALPHCVPDRDARPHVRMAGLGYDATLQAQPRRRLHLRLRVKTIRQENDECTCPTFEPAP